MTDAPPRQLVLREHETLSGIELSRPEVDALLACPADLLIQPMPGAPGSYSVRPGSKVGLLTAGKLALEIRPKVPVARLLFLLSYALEYGQWSDEATAAHPDATLTEALVFLYAQLVRRALARGVLQGYRTFEDALPGVRGRIRIDEQVRRHFGRAPPVEVRFDDFTEDIEANRLLKAALHVLGRVALRHPRSRQILRGLAQPLQRVSLIEYSRGQVPDVPVDRLNAHYAPALRMARAILQGTAVDLRHGQVAPTSLLFDMNAIFEGFLRRALREELALDARSFPRPGGAPPLWLDQAARVRLLPDLTWWRGCECIFVGDVKYKRVDSAGAVNADIYQLVAYLIATGLSHGLLVYAQGEEDVATHVINRAGKTVSVRPLELGGSIDQLRTRVRLLADSVARMGFSEQREQRYDLEAASP